MERENINIPKEYKYISAFLTMRCNLSCSFCLNSLGNNDNFNRNKFQEISGKDWVNALNGLNSRSDLPITFGGGEPFLHKDFIYILNNLKPELKIDILTNLHFGKRKIEEFISEIDPKRINRDAPYASIRVSYHPEQMNNGETLIENVKRLKDEGFDVGIWAVNHPSPENNLALTQMQFRCIDSGIDYRLKDFTGEYNGQRYGNYSKFLNSILEKDTKECMCKTSELLIGPDGQAYRCHSDLYQEENAIGSITNPNFQVENIFRSCDKYGQCHPCDVKLKTNYKQKLGHTSVEIKDIK
jgi:radical SAM protein with 4Fe4S-binding SPASM domain|tara:strand:- start:447 stop:1340 length:894 start_codon:yes stop_codon:yes gene_type:complete